jgi:hypothetical protein
LHGIVNSSAVLNCVSLDWRGEQELSTMDREPYYEHPLTRRIDTDIVREESNHYQFIAARLVELLGTVVTSLLLIRFGFMLLGANAANGFAAFVYGFTAPLVLPFQGLFMHDSVTYGVSQFEGYTLVAAAFYALLAAGLRRLAIIARW